MEVFMDYIMKSPAKAQVALVDILMFVKDQLPDAERKVYYGVPMFFVEGGSTVNIGAYKDHFSVWTGCECELSDYLKPKYPDYKYTKATIQFPYTEPVPFHILEDICRFAAK